MIAFHYPPFTGGSGVHRTLKFSRYLPQFGWKPIILTAHSRAYPQTGSHQLQEIPSDVLVKRAFALDTSRHLSIKGSYIKSFALPDRWVSWLAGAVPLGLSIIRKYKPEAIWSTYPIATAHLIGFVLKKMTGLPWIADFRDSMTEENYPSDPPTKKWYQWIEQKTVSTSQCCIFTASSTRDMYLTRYSTLHPDVCKVIPNGFDEEDFKNLDILRHDTMNTKQPLRIVHAGVVYPAERDPQSFFNALATLKRDGIIVPEEIRIELRGAGSEDLYSSMIKDLQIQDLVHLLPSVPYHAVLQDCASADALLLLQGPSCNHQIPAKAYEYLRFGKPILALVDEKGDTAALLKENGGASIIDLMDEKALCQSLPEFFDAVRQGRHAVCSRQKSQRYARHMQAAELAQHLGNLVPDNIMTTKGSM